MITPGSVSYRGVGVIADPLRKIFLSIAAKYCGGRACGSMAYNFARKILQINNLRAKYSKIRSCGVVCGCECEKYFLSKLRKILITGRLWTQGSPGGSQNIVKEGLTRKIFQDRELAILEEIPISRYG
jgi:hypothetical protein